MKILHVDAPSGLAGDMLAAALLDVGAPVEVLEECVARLGLGVTLSHAHVERSGIRARRFLVAAESDLERDHASIRALLEANPFPGVEGALAAFSRLAEAEAEVHGVPPDEVHFHEVGAVDSIVDVVAVSRALATLEVDRLTCTPLPLGRGYVDSRHGRLPLPAPATLLCLRGAPTYDGGVDAELVTPTGASLVAGAEFLRWPAMRTEAVGWGAGARELADRPNVVRVVLGASVGEGERMVLLETNLDDATAETLAYALQRALEEGARDAWATPLLMKKGRAATMLSVLVAPPQVEALRELLLVETGTLGVRAREVERVARPRRVIQVETELGAVPVKIAEGDGLPRRVKPEHDACAALARETGRPLREIYAMVLAAVER